MPFLFINKQCLINLCLVTYLHPVDNDPKIIPKADFNFAKKLDFKDINFPVKVRDIQKIEKRNSISINVTGYENKEKHPIYLPTKCCEEKYVNLLLIGEEDCSQAFSTKEILKFYIRDYFKINGIQRIKMPKKGEYTKPKSYEKKSPFMIYADFESILVPENNGKRNPDE